MMAFGEQLAKGLVAPATIELIGDIGTGKTTLVKGLARGLGIISEVTSPSFVVSKTYRSGKKPLTLTHFDFYRLTDPGIMQEELDESINSPGTITVIEWAAAVENVLPEGRTKITISYNDDGTRTVEVER